MSDRNNVALASPHSGDVAWIKCTSHLEWIGSSNCASAQDHQNRFKGRNFSQHCEHNIFSPIISATITVHNYFNSLHCHIGPPQASSIHIINCATANHRSKFDILGRKQIFKCLAATKLVKTCTDAKIRTE